MSVLVTKVAPDFTAKAVMPDNQIKEVSLSSYRGKYVLLFFYPLDFTFVCPSEILAFNKAVKAFEKKGAVVLGVSVDSQYSHFAWRQTAVNKGGIGEISFPLIADLDKKIARDYDVLLGDAVALRGQFLIDQKGIVRHQLVNDLPIGRNVEEALRTLDALKFHEEHGDVCPANWKEGEDAMKPTADGVASYLAKHAK